MQLTNRLNLPTPIVMAIANDDYDGKRADIGGSALSQPPRIRQLTRRHWDDITVDVADRIWPLLGSNTHYILERANIQNAIQEERFDMEVEGWTVSCKPDLFWNRALYDWKITSVWAVLNGIKTEWEQQLNVYAEVLRRHGHTVVAAMIIAIMRDWSKHQIKRSSDYPDTQVRQIPVKLWPEEKANLWIQDRVQLHQETENLPDHELPVCTPEERWERPTTYAVKIKGQKRAKRVLGSHEEAEAWGSKHLDGKRWEIEVREGESVRCGSYCDVNKWCDYYTKEV